MVTLTLAAASAITAADHNVKVTCTAPQTGTGNKLADGLGNEVANTTADTDYPNGWPVVNQLAETDPPEFQSAVVDGRVLTITYNEPLDSGSTPAPAPWVPATGRSPKRISGVWLDHIIRQQAPKAVSATAPCGYTNRRPAGFRAGSSSKPPPASGSRLWKRRTWRISRWCDGRMPSVGLSFGYQILITYSDDSARP